MGVLANRLGMLDRSLVPPLEWVEIFRRMCLQSHLQTSPPTPQKSYPKFRNPRTTFENTSSYFWCVGPHAKFWNPRTTFENTPLCASKYSIELRVVGSPNNFVGILIFLQDFGTLQQPLLGESAMSRKKREERKIPFIVATYVSACSQRAVHALCSDQKGPPLKATT
jgi:hypothetical protein